MAPLICVYEDEKVSQFYPLSLLRPVYTMRAGILPIFKRIEHVFPDSACSFAARGELAPLLTSQLGGAPVNIIKRDDEDVLLLNGRIRNFGDLVQRVGEARLSTVFHSQGEVVGVLFQRESLEKTPKVATPEEYFRIYTSHADDFAEFETTAKLYAYPWEFVEDIEPAIVEDFRTVSVEMSGQKQVSVEPGALLINERQIYFGDGVEVRPGAVIDASGGPVYIGANTRIEPQAALYGPCYIGPNAVIVAGKITGSSIGHTCRVGGEVEESVFQAYVNKYHAGFIGHAYVGAWVNFGAMTTNSDLKNNYSNIRVSLGGKAIDTGSIKVGSFIGDHTKFGIGTLLTTGIVVGVCSNIFGGALVTDKEVPSFAWGTTGGYQPYKIEKALETVARTMNRRNVELTSHETSLLRAIHTGEIPAEGCLEFRLPS